MGFTVSENSITSKASPSLRDPSQQVMENSVLQRHTCIQNQILEVRRGGGGLPAPPLSGLPGAARPAKVPRRCLSRGGGNPPRGPGFPAGGCRRRRGWEQQRCGVRGAGGRRGADKAAGGGREESAGAAFSATNLFQSIPGCPSAIARVQVGERDGICASLAHQYFCLK